MSMSMQCGGYVLLMRCPRCQQAAEVYVVIGTRLTAEDDGATLRPTLHAKAVDHMCGQMNMVDADDAPAFDFAERAAGAHLER